MRQPYRRFAHVLLAVTLLLGSLTACGPFKFGPQASTPTSTVPAVPPPVGDPVFATPIFDPNPPASLHLTLGNPSGAVANPAQPTNYLIIRDQYALAYNRDRGIPTWVSWHLAASDLGPTARYTGSFITDTSLPDGWPRVVHADYNNSGYDRGHMTPSADRTASDANNEATFILTNVLPQAPAINRGPWEQFEAYARTLADQGNELYIVAGSAGSQGTLAGGKLTIPAATWKLMLVLPAATSADVARITAQTPVLAVWMPNTVGVDAQPWASYATTVRCLEERTGLQFLTTLPPAVQIALKGQGCDGTAPTAAVAPAVAPTSAAIAITKIEYDPPGDDLAGEYVLLRNDGGSAADLTGWTLRDQANTTYTFPAFTLAAGAEVKVWVKVGTNDAGNLYWGRGQSVWNNTGDTATLSDAAGAVVAQSQYQN